MKSSLTAKALFSKSVLRLFSSVKNKSSYKTGNKQADLLKTAFCEIPGVCLSLKHGVIYSLRACLCVICIWRHLSLELHEMIILLFVLSSPQARVVLCRASLGLSVSV